MVLEKPDPLHARTCSNGRPRGIRMVRTEAFGKEIAQISLRRGIGEGTSAERGSVAHIGVSLLSALSREGAHGRFRPRRDQDVSGEISRGKAVGGRTC